MKIAIVTAFFPPNVLGGAEISSYNLAKVLANNGDEVHIITPDFGTKEGCKDFKNENNDLHLHYFKYPFPLKSNVSYLRVLLYNPLFLLIFLIKIVCMILKYKIEVVHGHGDEGNIVSWLASRITGRPVVITLYDWRFICAQSLCTENGKIEVNCNLNHYLKCSWALSKRTKFRIFYILGTLYLYLYLQMNKIILEKTDRIMAIGDFIKEVAIKAGIPDENINVIYQISNPLEDIGDAKLNFENYEVITFAGRLDPIKGVHILIEAFKEVNKVTSSKLLLIGDTNNKYSNDLKDLIEKLNMKNDIIFIGKLSNREVLKYFRKSDLVVVPSIWPEPQGRTVLEALYVGTPVVASNIGGISELIDKNDGVLVKPNDIDSLSGGILRALSKKTKFSPNPNKKHLKASFIYSETKKVYKDVITHVAS